ncbi:hypothetical protein, partial [Phenylobacterium sp.]|uniref:hypothetical protein n=1 Tax=Phenylobacterium sp. TaxID=1871053 RepID=UPI0035C79F88
MKTLTLAMSLLLACFGSSGRASAAGPSDEACRAARHVIGEVMRAYPEVTAWIVDDPRWETLEGSGSEAEPVAPGSDEVSLNRWRGDPPSLQLLRAQGSHMAGPITECPSLQNALGSKVTVGRAAGDQVLRQLERGRGEETEAMPSILEVATLTVSPDAEEALV